MQNVCYTNETILFGVGLVHGCGDICTFNSYGSR